MSDTLALVQSGALTLANWSALAQRVAALPADERAAPSQAVLSGWTWFVDAAGPGLLQDALRQQARAGLAPELQRLGLDPRTDEPAPDTLLRNALLRTLVTWGDPALRDEALRRVRAELDGTGVLPPQTRQTWLESAGTAADVLLYERLLDAAQAATATSERSTLLEALAANQDPELAARTLGLSLQGRLQPPDAFGLPSRVARASPHAAAAYAHVTAHFDALVGLLPGAGFGQRERLLPNVAIRLKGAEDARRLLQDQARLVGEGGAVNARRAAQQLMLRDRWRTREGAQVLGQWWAAQR
jgi:aminopeptidase N